MISGGSTALPYPILCSAAPFALLSGRWAGGWRYIYLQAAKLVFCLVKFLVGSYPGTDYGCPFLLQDIGIHIHGIGDSDYFDPCVIVIDVCLDLCVHVVFISTSECACAHVRS